MAKKPRSGGAPTRHGLTASAEVAEGTAGVDAPRGGRREKIVACVAEKLKVAPATVTDDTVVADNGVGLDGLGMWELMLALEKSFGVSNKLNAVANETKGLTLKKLVEMVNTLLDA